MLERRLLVDVHAANHVAVVALLAEHHVHVGKSSS
jgi:hypothetical protein